MSGQSYALVTRRSEVAVVRILAHGLPVPQTSVDLTAGLLGALSVGLIVAGCATTAPAFVGPGYSLVVPETLQAGYQSNGEYGDYWRVKDSSGRDVMLDVGVNRDEALSSLDEVAAFNRANLVKYGWTILSETRTRLPAGPAVRYTLIGCTTGTSSPPPATADENTCVTYLLYQDHVVFVLIFVNVASDDEQMVVQSLRLNP
jgi:hypothetical protein